MIWNFSMSVIVTSTLTVQLQLYAKGWGVQTVVLYTIIILCIIVTLNTYVYK